MTRPPRRRLAPPLKSERYLALRHGRAIIKAQERREAAANDPESIVHEEAKLADGVAQFNSAEVPGLQFRTYSIEAKQKINVNPKDSNQAADAQPVTTQEFEVKGPRFALPENAIYSFYPPEGHSDTTDVLPHVIFNDPEFPWERIGSIDAAQSGRPLGDRDWQRNRTPWLAVLVFTQDELSLTPNELTTIFANSSLNGQSLEQTATWAVKMPTADIKNIASAPVPVPYKGELDSGLEPKTSMIFLKPSLFNGLFANYDNQGNRIPRISNGKEVPTVWQHRFLAHVRTMNPKGMAWADQEEEVVNRPFSIVVSNRTGPLLPLPAAQPDKPPEIQVVAVHLVSIENVEQMPYPLPLDGTVQRVGLVSLFSWTFQCLPPGSVTVSDTLSALGRTSAPLCAQPPPPASPPTPAHERMRQRILDGYTLTKYRVQTGEETLGFYRGPLTPTTVTHQNWELLSNSGMNLQILDAELGIMDITYSAAWQLGRTLALANRAYGAALSRVRRAILALAPSDAQEQTLEAAGMDASALSRKELASQIPDLLREVSELSRCHERPNIQSTVRRYEQVEGEIPNLSYDSPGVSFFSQDALDKAAKKIASTTDFVDPKDPTNLHPYDEYNTPFSPDWVLVLHFVLDLYNLIDVPLHYLLPDMAQVPLESLRYFVIDLDWVEALIDGALSLGNQGTLSLKGVDKQPNDLVRRSIKVAIKDYFEFTNSTLKYKPPVPKFGFFMRSDIVAKFPDLKIDVQPPQDPNGAPLLLRHSIIGTNLMLTFFGDVNAPSGKLDAITLTLPPHQQSFSAARSVTDSKITISYKRIYTEAGHDNDPSRQTPIIDKLQWDKGVASTRPAVFKWESDPGANDVRILLMENFAIDLYNSLNTALGTSFQEICPTSAMMAFQLNSPAWQLLTNVSGLPPMASSHFLSYPPKNIHPLHLAGPNLPHWPQKRALPSTSDLKAQDLGPALKLSVLPAYTKRLLPASLFTDEPNLSSDQASDFHLDTDSRSSSNSSHCTAPRIHQPRWSLATTGGGVPRFECTVRPAADPGSLDIPLTPRRQDLVFSIIFRGGANTFLLESIVVSIPLLGSSDTKDWLMAAPPRGGRAFMVSNLRFNAALAFSDQQATLKITILPRSTKGYVRLDKMEPGVTEMSVVLVGATVRLDRGEMDARCSVKPNYSNSLSDPIPCLAQLRKSRPRCKCEAN